MSPRSVLPFILVLSACQKAPDATPAAAQPATVPLTITTAGGARNFSVEAALTQAEQDKGLSGRATLAVDRGMLFPLQPARAPSFWTKDYRVAVDTLMVAPDGRIAAIFENRKPDSLEPASSGDPMIAVLEVAAGRVKALGVKIGDLVRWGQCPGGATRPGEAWDRLSFCPA